MTQNKTTKIVQFNSNNEEIFTDEEKKGIINMFPENMREYLAPLNNPLDQTQVILSLIKDKNIKLIFKKIIDEFGDEENDPLFCARDVARMINYSEKHINQWKKWLNDEDYIKYSDIKNNNPQIKGDEILNLDTKIEDPQNGGDGFFCSFNTKTTHIHGDTIFLTIEGLKKVLSNVTVEGAIEYKTWINNLATIMKKLIKWIHKIKCRMEINKEVEKHIDENNKLKNKLKSEDEIKLRIEQSFLLFPKPERINGNIYAITSKDKLKKNAIKFGNTAADVETRKSSLKTGDPDLYIIYFEKVMDMNMAEDIIHYYLDELRYDGEFFYVSSENVAKNILKMIANFVNEFVSTFDGDYKIMQDKYVRDDIHIDEYERKRSRSRSPSSRMTRVIRNKNLFKSKNPQAFDIFKNDNSESNNCAKPNDDSNDIFINNKQPTKKNNKKGNISESETSSSSSLSISNKQNKQNKEIDDRSETSSSSTSSSLSTSNKQNKENVDKSETSSSKKNTKQLINKENVEIKIVDKSVNESRMWNLYCTEFIDHLENNKIDFDKDDKILNDTIFITKNKHLFEQEYVIPNNKSSDLYIKKLGKWFSHQKENYEKKIGSVYKYENKERWEQIMEDYKTCFITNDQNWHKHFERTKAFIDHYRRVPLYNAASVFEKCLGYWLKHQKENYMNVTQIMKNVNKRQLYEKFINDDYKIYFINSSSDYDWEYYYKQVISFVNKNKILPQDSNDVEEKMLYNWIMIHKKNYEEFNGEMRITKNRKMWQSIQSKYILQDNYK